MGYRSNIRCARSRPLRENRRVNQESIHRIDALRALAFMGDLSMGQPIDHSSRVARLADALAQALALDAGMRADLLQVALLRWSGCTANAADVAQTISDDVSGRAAMLALQMDKIQLLVPPESLPERIGTISAIHCEVSAVIADLLGLRSSVAEALRCTFERWDGTGEPRGLRGGAIPLATLVVSLAGDLEIFARVYGLPGALALLKQRAGTHYPAEHVSVVCEHAQGWLSALAQDPEAALEPAEPGEPVDAMVSLALVADAIDLKLPWLVGHSRAVAWLGAAIAQRLGLTPMEQARVQRAGLLHGLGRVGIPNASWDPEGPLSAAEQEKIRLSSYWTGRAARQIRRLEPEAEIASWVCERLDGTGHFRGAGEASTPMVCRVLPVAATWTALQAWRPWRSALTPAEASREMERRARQGLFDPRVVQALDEDASAAPRHAAASAESRGILSARELEVLRRISLGDSNKDAARELAISPATVRTHIESVFRKLGCSSRAAATLKASAMGLLSRDAG